MHTSFWEYCNVDVFASRAPIHTTLAHIAHSFGFHWSIWWAPILSVEDRVASCSIRWRATKCSDRVRRVAISFRFHSFVQFVNCILFLYFLFQLNCTKTHISAVISHAMLLLLLQQYSAMSFVFFSFVFLEKCSVVKPTRRFIFRSLLSTHDCAKRMQIQAKWVECE